jgi:hypothetical protein
MLQISPAIAIKISPVTTIEPLEISAPVSMTSSMLLIYCETKKSISVCGMMPSAVPAMNGANRTFVAASMYA